MRQFLDSFGGTEQSTGGVPQDSSYGSGNEKQDSKSRADVKLSHLAAGMDSTSSVQTTETRLADLLDSTLWNRRLAPSSERIVYALVQQIFHGIREYFLASAELKVCHKLFISVKCFDHHSYNYALYMFLSFMFGSYSEMCYHNGIL